MKRRDFLKKSLAAAGAMAVSAPFTPALAATKPASGTGPAGEITARTDRSADTVKPAAPDRVSSFGLSDVRLLEGPFQQARDRDAQYLLQLDADRLLHNFHVNAGLPPKAPVYGGWESEATWADIRCHGHTLGHYLSACALMFASTQDTRFKTRVAYLSSELKACQEAGRKNGMDGLVCAFPDGKAQFDNMVAGRPSTGVPWYTTHKVLAGLREAYLYCDDATALAVLIGVCDWADQQTHAMTEAQFQRMLGTEHGGMNEVLGDVYALTGDAKHRVLAERFCHRAILDPLAQGQDILDGLHANTQIPKVVGFARLYALTGRPEYQAASRFFWHTVVQNRSFATGGHGDGEHFFPPAQFASHLHSAKTMETCGVYNMLKLTRRLFTQDPTADYADYYERALYNDILASQDPDSGMMTYFQATRPGYRKLYCTPTESFWCCTGTGIENHAKYNDSIYFHSADALYVNLFIPSVLTWRQKGLTLTQNTAFPQEDVTRLTVTAARPTRLALKIRCPGWCSRATVSVNGRHLPVSGLPGDYLTIDRQWRSGDTVQVHLPMTLHTEALPGSPRTVAVLYGPIVLAGSLGSGGIAPGEDLIHNERTYGNVLNQPVEVPVWVGEPEKVVERIVPSAGTPLTFHTMGLGRPQDVTLTPYYRIGHERYNLYWTLVAPEGTPGAGASAA